MDPFLKGKTAVVTGGTRGIGRAIAAALAQAGAAVAICARSQESVAAAVEELRKETGGRIAGQAADVRDPASVGELFAMVDRELGGVDILVNNAGIGGFAAVADMRPEEWRQVIDTNLTGVFHCCREALRRFRKRGGGFLIQIGSLAGKNAFAGGAAYNASKFALNGFAEAMMLDHRYENVRVSTILPGSVATGFRGRFADKGDHWKIAPEDLAEIVLMVLRMPERTMISHIEVRPSKPVKG